MSNYNNFSKNMEIEEILKIMDQSGGNIQTIHAGPCFSQYKLHQELIKESNKMHRELMKEQQDFQNKNLKITKWLVLGTWALVIATFFLSFRR